MSKSRNLYVKPRFWLILMAALLIMMMPLYISISNKRADLTETYNQKVMERDQLKDQVLKLDEDLAYLRSEQGIEQYARAAGMIMPGEVQFTIGENKH